MASTSRNTLDEQDQLDSNASSSDDDEVDPVVRRLKVFYTPTYLSSLTLLQYPDRAPRPATAHPLIPPSLRPGADSDDEGTNSGELSIRYKPNSQHLEIQIPIERHEERYNEDVSRELAKGVIDEKESESAREREAQKKGKKRKNFQEEEDERRKERETQENKRLDKIIYSSISVPDATNYLVGVVKGETLHLSPVTQTYQMRPSLTYLDNIITLERRRKREEKANLDADNDSEAEISDTELKKEEAKAVQVSVKQAENGGRTALGPGNGRAGAGLFAPLRAQEGEAWINLEHFHAETRQAGVAVEKMFVSDAGAEVKLASVTKPSEYMK